MLLSSTQEVEVELVPGSVMTATIDNKTCVAGCVGEGDCREGEQDPELGAATQYTCNDKDGVKFCYDPRNLVDGYTAEQF